MYIARAMRECGSEKTKDWCRARKECSKIKDKKPTSLEEEVMNSKFFEMLDGDL